MSGLYKKFSWKSRIAVLFLLDILFISSSYLFFLFRYRLHEPQMTWPVYWTIYLTMLGCVMACRVTLKAYNHMWRYATSDTFLLMVFADFFGGALYYAIDRIVLTHHLPISIFVSAFCVGLLLTLVSRFLYQFLRRRDLFLFPSRSVVPIDKKNKINVAIVGAGEMGVFLVQELLMNHNSRYHPVFLIDNDRRKIGTVIEGIKVIGPDHEVISTIHTLPIQEIIIALPKLNPERRDEIFRQYMTTGCKVMVYDYPVERIGLEKTKRLVRDINIEDLLFRETVSMDDQGAKSYYQGKTILVTGAGGSIGSELCRQLARMQPKRLILLDVYENGVYDLGQELKRQYGAALDWKTVIASVCDRTRINEVFVRFHPQVVFHAAAHKHVPLMEENCGEAIHNNVFGTFYTALAAEKNGTERFILISTDKAVNPTNMMGATKRLCEMVIQSRQDSDTDFVAVRFGNVLGSNGSVVPLFRKQIEEGGPVTITDKRIIRYFMTIPEAAQLVLRCGRRAERNEVYVLDMGKPVKIIDLANKLISLSGFVPDKDIKIKEIGLRPGEKLYEELLVKADECRKTADERVFIELVPAAAKDEVDKTLNALRQAIDMRADDSLLKELMMRILPSYREATEVNRHAAETPEVSAANAAALEITEPLGIPI